MKHRENKENNPANNRAPDTPRARYHIHLKTTEDVRRLLSVTINQLRGGEVEVGVAGKIGYLSSILVGIIETCDLEKRVVELEEAMKNRKERS